ncbi:hypothetical protein MUP77_16340 [Candidatus Bathyarchaeota archaeon]|nr:hypothetical protein [Candidatus Bathyarchaeota archaeon]
MGKNEYVACGLCGMNKILRSEKRAKWKKPVELRWPSFSVKDAYILQVREGGGKKSGSGKKGRGKAPGSGFHLIKEESLTLKEMIDSSQYDRVLQGMRKQLVRVVRDCLEIGFIEKDDFNDVQPTPKEDSVPTKS